MIPHVKRRQVHRDRKELSSHLRLVQMPRKEEHGAVNGYGFFGSGEEG